MGRERRYLKDFTERFTAEYENGEKAGKHLYATIPIYDIMKEI